MLVSEEGGREEELQGPWSQGVLLATSGQGGIRTRTEPDRSGYLARLSCICSLGYLFSQMVYICGLLAVCSSIWGAGATDSLGQTCSLSKWQYREAQALVQRQLREGGTQEPPLKVAAKPHNELGMVVPACNPSMWQTEAGGSL